MRGMSWLQRTIGQRNALLVFAAVIALIGALRMSGVWECSTGCVPGWEIPEGIFMVAVATLMAAFAVRLQDNRHEAAEFDASYYGYDPKDWAFSRWGLANVLAVTLGLAIAVVIFGLLR